MKVSKNIIFFSKILRFINLLFICFLSFGGIYSDLFSCYMKSNDLHQKINVKLDSSFSMSHLDYYGFDMESIRLIDDGRIEIIVDSYEKEILDSKNVSYSILNPDLGLDYDIKYQTWSNQKASKDFMLHNSDFVNGSMGGYFTLEETYSKFDSLKINFPEFLVKVDTLSFTFENRPIIAYTLGDTISKQNEILITSLHHAREPGSVSVVLFFLEDLLMRAETGDKEAIYLLENRTIYVIPVVNPDGLYFNQITRPQGGGMWRKNRFVNSDSSIGVDLNRNYGPYEYWNAPINGSSEEPSEVTYRGTAPFSEKETSAIRDFVLSKNIKMALNYHTYGNILIYPLSALSKETNDSMVFRKLCSVFSKDSRYIYGLDRQTINYSGRGVADDWLYWTDDTKRNKVLAITPEVGSVADNFWTTPDRILAQCLENLNMNYQFLWSADINWRPQELILEKKGATDYLKLHFSNIGRTSSLNKPDYKIKSIDQNVNIFQTPDYEYFGKDEYRVAYRFGLTESMKNGNLSLFQVEVIQDGISRLDTFAIELWQPESIILFDDEELKGNWNQGNWKGEYNPDKQRFVLSDSPNAYYPDRDSNYLQLIEPIRLDFNNAVLHFQSFWEIEPNYDYGIIEISEDNGKNWEKLDADKMAFGSGAKSSSIQSYENGYTGYSLGWVNQSISLNEYLGKSILIRFGMLSDLSSSAPGWRIDSMFIKTYSDILGVQDEVGQQIEIMPIPADNKLIIMFENEITSDQVRIFKLNGELVTVPVNVVNSEFILDISGLSSGIYFIKVGNILRKFVKN